jgi:hypothetical protein
MFPPSLFAFNTHARTTVQRATKNFDEQQRLLHCEVPGNDDADIPIARLLSLNTTALKMKLMGPNKGYHMSPEVTMARDGVKPTAKRFRLDEFDQNWQTNMHDSSEKTIGACLHCQLFLLDNQENYQADCRAFLFYETYGVDALVAHESLQRVGWDMQRRAEGLKLFVEVRGAPICT